MRTRGPDHAATREQILDAARRLVLRDGHAGLSLRELARETGFAEPVRVLREQAGDRRCALRPRRRRPARGAAARRKGPIRQARCHRGARRRALAYAAPPESPYQVVVAAVADAREAGLLRGSPETIAYALWATAHGMAMLQLTHLAGFAADFATADRAALDALIAGFAPR